MIQAPTRTQDQRMAALLRANDIRVRRAAVKRSIRQGDVSIVDVIAAPSDCVYTAKVMEMLLAVPRMGSVRAVRFMNSHRVSQSKTVGGLSDRQRGELVKALAAA